MTEPSATKPDTPRRRRSTDVPLTLGQLGMWVFLTTEVMFFAALIAAALVFRLSNPETIWPRPSALHVSLPIGLVNTVLLVSSGLVAFAACAAARADRAVRSKLLLILTMALGVAFLTNKFREYGELYRLGLFPSPERRQICEEANRAYLSSVDQRLAELIADAEQQRSESPDRVDHQRLDLLYLLRSSMTGHTASFLGRGGDAWRADNMLNVVAYQIYPHADTTRGMEEAVTAELLELAGMRNQVELRLALINRRIPGIEEQIQQLTRTTAQGAPGETPGEQSTENGFQPDEWLKVKEEQHRQLNVERERLELLLKPVVDRMRVLGFIGNSDFDEGLNSVLGLRLPVVVRNGHTWMSVFLLLTGMHALHLIAGLIAYVGFLPRRLDRQRAGSLYVTSMYWQFVDIAWLAIFFIVYF